MIKVDIISGFLGAGKTTLIKRLFESDIKNEKKVLIENEFGEISVDGAFLKNSGVEIKEINAGCICCSLVGDFEKSIKEVVERFHPERIIIEPSGVGKLSDIINAIKNAHVEELKLNMLVTVVDGLKAKIYLKNFGEFFLDQVNAASTIVISKLDKAKGNKDEIVNLVKEKNNHANIITTSINEFNPNTLLSLLENNSSLHQKFMEETLQETKEHECCHHHHDEEEHECDCHHHHEEEHECDCHYHHEEEEHECGCHHHDEEEHECGCHHHHDEEEHECGCHHHEEEEHECGCHHHDEEEHECGCHHHDEEEHECGCHHHHDEEHKHHHHADEIFTSWGKETTKAVSHDELKEFLDTLATSDDLGIIVRSKGILKATDNDKWYYFDFVSGDYEIRLGEPDYTGRIVVIGSKLNEEKIESLFFKK